LLVGDVGGNNPSGGLHRRSLWLLLFRTGKQQAANQKRECVGFHRATFSQFKSSQKSPAFFGGDITLID
jgi:hypothetical protein